MLEDIVIEPMTEEFILWRCLHSGPISRKTISNDCRTAPCHAHNFYHRNVPLLAKLTQVYGACTIIARADDQVVGQLRFYPKAIWEMKEAGELCLQQEYPCGPADTLARQDFPALDKIEDKTLVIHCLMTGSPQQATNLYQRKGIGTRMVKLLISWAKAKGWHCLEAKSFEDLAIIYDITGSAGRTFWEKLGFALVERAPHPYLQSPSEFVTTLEDQARSFGIPLDRARDQLIMRLSLRQ